MMSGQLVNGSVELKTAAPDTLSLGTGSSLHIDDAGVLLQTHNRNLGGAIQFMTGRFPPLSLSETAPLVEGAVPLSALSLKNQHAVITFQDGNSGTWICGGSVGA
jgi:hypothetical protein